MPSCLPLSSHTLAKDPKYATAIQNLSESSYREVKRDGNCLYASIALHILPYLHSSPFHQKFFGFNHTFDALDIPNVVYEPYISCIEEAITSLTADSASSDDLSVFIAYLRLICSAHAISNCDKYQSFLDCDLKRYCVECIDPMEQRAGEFELAVLSDALGLKITVVSIVDEINRSFGEGKEIKILHTPDHFEPIYD